AAKLEAVLDQLALVEDHRPGHEVNEFGPKRLVEDLAPDDFETYVRGFPPTWGMAARSVEIARVRVLFGFGYKQQLIPHPIIFGLGMSAPSAKEKRKARAAAGERMYSADEVRRVLAVCKPQLRAAVLLAINCAYGNGDVASLPLSALDLQEGWATFPRPKTGEARRAWLWPETRAALQWVVANRPNPAGAENGSLVFLSRDGRPWVHLATRKHDDDERETIVAIDRLTKQFWYYCKRAGVPQRGFYTLRRTWRTVADETLDMPACNRVMGHTDSTMAGVYRQRIGDDRIRRVCEHVRTWLFPAEGGAK
ncbi:MAG: tyrosine-type recombinase/integrase, partial [Planctomycetota bacterium]